jgi:hypothetical protein
MKILVPALLLTALLFPIVRAGIIDTASAKILYSSAADKMKSFRVVEGRLEHVSLGTRLHANSRVHLERPHKRSITNILLHLDFYPPRIDRASMLLRLKDNECYCALTIRAGRLGIEISERWVRAFALDKNYSHTDTVFAHADIEMNPDGNERILSVSIRDNKAHIAVNDTTMLTTTVHYHDFRKIAIDSYNHPFTIASFILFSLEPDSLSINADSGFVDARAEYFPSRFNNAGGIKNHHFAASEGGRAAPHALFTTIASAQQIYDALVAAGAQPGNNLSRQTWTKRRSSRSREPDKKAEGSAIGIQIRFADSAYAPQDVLSDAQQNDFIFRFAGNRENIAHWRSGGIVCLQSCPGGAIGNRTYSIRDLVKSKLTFSPVRGLPFYEGEKVTLRFIVQKE